MLLCISVEVSKLRLSENNDNVASLIKIKLHAIFGNFDLHFYTVAECNIYSGQNIYNTYNICIGHLFIKGSFVCPDEKAINFFLKSLARLILKR